MSYPTYDEMEAVAEKHGHTIDDVLDCSIQGVMIGYSRPTRPGETLLGLPVAGERQQSEVIERHYCPEPRASQAVMAVTLGRAMQRVVWEIEMAARDAEPVVIPNDGAEHSCPCGRTGFRAWDGDGWLPRGKLLVTNDEGECTGWCGGCGRELEAREAR